MCERHALEAGAEGRGAGVIGWVDLADADDTVRVMLTLDAPGSGGARI